MEELRAKARELLGGLKGDAYAFGPGAIERAGALAAHIGREFLLVRGRACDGNGMLAGLKESFEAAGVTIIAECPGAAPNSPIEDVQRVRDEILRTKPDAVVGLGGGSLLDALKGSVTLACLGGACEDYFGVRKVTARLAQAGRRLIPLFAI